MPVKRKKRLEWSRRSAQDLLDIEGYIARDSQAAADSVINHIRQRVMLLEIAPLLGKRRTATSHRELVLTRFPFTVVYPVRGGSVLVVRILHQRMRYP